MPLPAALAARLAKRGIVSQGNEEEVIAEDYDGNKSQPPANSPRLDEFGNLLPHHWSKVWDTRYETWYYWDTIRDMVSWLPPGDPEAVITFPTKPAVETSTEPPPEEVRREEYRKFKEKNRGKARQVRWQNADDEADPMDPSSYSDAPAGDWKRGLKKPDDAKSGVDSTASGPLFQQRPYPSPGEVLKRNKQASIVGPQKPR